MKHSRYDGIVIGCLPSILTGDSDFATAHKMKTAQTLPKTKGLETCIKYMLLIVQYHLWIRTELIAAGLEF